LLTIALLCLLTAYLFYPALFLGQSLVHGDNIHHGYSFLTFHHNVIHRGLSPLWTNMVYGGHALFAEGQAGLSNPFNYLVAWLFSPVFGMNLIHWASMVAVGIGAFGLCRCLSISGPSAMFAALACTFSSLFIHSNTNMTAIEAMVWIPWTLWAFEAWLKRPGAVQTVLFGLSTSMLIFSGYPHFLHGTAIYMLVSMTTLFFDRDLANSPKKVLERYWGPGLIAIVICVGISCIQWLPLYELSSYSHRQDGTNVSAHGTSVYALRGLIFSSVTTNLPEDQHVLYFPNVGSLLVCMLASLCLFLRGQWRMKGHLIATFLLVSLGLGEGSPLFRFLFTYNLIPGIDNFRILFPYFHPAVIGIAVLAAMGLDRLCKAAATEIPWRSPAFITKLLIAAAGWTYILISLRLDEPPLVNFLVCAAGISLWLGLVNANKARLTALVMVGLLLTEIILLKLQPFGTIDSQLIIDEPQSVKHIKAGADYLDFKHLQTGLVALTFTSPYGERLKPAAAHELKSIVASTNLLWGIPSFSGALALQLQNRPMVIKTVFEELSGKTDQQPGLRMIDIHSIKWVSMPRAEADKSLIPIKSPEGRLTVLENPHARPLIQTYTNVALAQSPEIALKLLKNSTEKTLVIENGPNHSPSAEQLSQPPTEVHLKNTKRAATRYKFKSEAEAGYWLFLADTNYPGWRATIDGKQTSIYTAQLLGKALYVPAGKHRITVAFESGSILLGATVSAISAMLIGFYFVLRHFRRRRHPARPV